MNLHHLAVFHAVAQCGTLTAAAERLRISQPALSRELKQFEERLGLPLFERLPRGMRLTEAGGVLADYAARLFEVEQAAEAAMRDLVDARQGHLALGASNTIGTYVLPRLLAAFRRDRPGVGLSLFVGNSEQVAQGVADMRFALGFVEGPLHVEGLEARVFQEDEILPVVAADHPLLNQWPLSPRDLTGQPLLSREPGSGTRELVDRLLRDNGIVTGTSVEFGNAVALKEAAIHGGGIAWLPRISMADDLERGLLRILPIPGLMIRRSFRVIQRRGGALAAAARAFLALVPSGPM